MAIVDLGTRPLIIGNNPVVYDPFPFLRTEAYLFAVTFTIGNPNNIFSNVAINALLDIPGLPNFIAATKIELDILPVLSTFFFPFSPLYSGDGNAFLVAERISFRAGTADAETTVQMNIIYDDATTVPTWRG